MVDINKGLALIEERLRDTPTSEVEAAASGAGVAVSRFVEGITSEVELRGDLEALGYLGSREDNYVLQAQLRRHLELFRDRRDIWRRQYSNGELTGSEFATLLEDAGLSNINVILELERYGPQAPKAVRESVQIGMSVLSAVEARTPVPAQPVALGLKVLESAQAEIVKPVELPVQVSLAVLEAERVEEVAVGELPVQLSLSVLEAVPVELVPTVELPVEVSLTVLEAVGLPAPLALRRVQATLSILEVHPPEVIDMGLRPVETMLLILDHTEV